MGGEGQGQDGLGTFASIALPLAMGAAGFVRPEATQGFMGMANILAQQSLMGQRTEDEARKKREEERELEQSGAIAEQMAKLGLTTDPRLSPATQVSFGNTQVAMRKAQKEAEDALNAQRTMGGIQDIRSRIGTVPLAALRTTLQELAPQVGTQQAAEQYNFALKDVAEQQKRAGMVGGVENLLPPPVFGPPLVNEPPEGMTAEEQLQAGRRAAGDMAQADPRLDALKTYIRQTGEMPKAPEASAMFNIPLNLLPGGVEAQQARMKPPFAPQLQTSPTGEVTGVTVSPQTGQLTTQPLGPIGQVQQPASRNQAELLNSLAMRMQGQIEGVMPEHRRLSPQAAAEVADTISRIASEVTPTLAFEALRFEVLTLEDEIKALKSRAQADPVARERLDEQTAKMMALRNAMKRFQVPTSRRSGPPSAPPPPAPGGARSELEDAGVVAPRR